MEQNGTDVKDWMWVVRFLGCGWEEANDMYEYECTSIIRIPGWCDCRWMRVGKKGPKV